MGLRAEVCPSSLLLWVCSRAFQKVIVGGMLGRASVVAKFVSTRAMAVGAYELSWSNGVIINGASLAPKFVVLPSPPLGRVERRFGCVTAWELPVLRGEMMIEAAPARPKQMTKAERGPTAH